MTFNSASILRSFWAGIDWPESIEWIVVDNDSNDDSVAVAKSLGARVISLDTNNGFSFANNVAAASSSADVLIFANPDLRLNIEDVPALASRALETSGIVAPQLVNSDGSPQENGRGIPYIHRKLRHMFGTHNLDSDPYLIVASSGEVVDALWVMGAALALPKQVFDSLGGWDNRFFIYYEDHELGIRARKAGVRVLIDGNLRWEHGWARETAARKSWKPWAHELASALRFYSAHPWALVPLVRPPAYTLLPGPIPNRSLNVLAKQQPLVTVILAAYNIENHLPSALDSLVAQTYPNIEILLVNDGSTDGTLVLLESFAEAHPNATVISQENKGLSGARNTGLDSASGEWLTFLDGDDFLAQDAVEVLLGLALSTDAQIACSNLHVISGNKTSPIHPDDSREFVMSQRGALESGLYQGPINVSACGKIYATEIFQNVRFPESRIYEEIYIFGDIVRQVESVAYTSRPVYNYVLRDGSITRQHYTDILLQQIEAADRLSSISESLHPDLHRAALRRRVQARLSVLRYMVDIDQNAIPKRKELQSFVRRNALKVLSDRRASFRDKVAVASASLSYGLFIRLWQWQEARK